MSLELTASSVYGRRTTNLPAFNQAQTWAGWLYFISNGTGYNSVINGSASDATTDCQGLDINNNGSNNRVLLFAERSGYQEARGVTNITVNTWIFLAWVRTAAPASSGQMIAYMAPGVGSALAQETTLTFPTSNWSASIGFLQFGILQSTDPCNARFGPQWYWSGAALSLAELAQQMRQVVPIRTDSLHGWWPMLRGSQRNLDLSGNGRDWTIAGTPTDADDPPIPWSIPYTLSTYPPATSSQTIVANSVTTAESFGTPREVLSITPSSVATAAAFGTAQLNLRLNPVALASAEAFGTAVMALTLKPSAVGSGESFGSPALSVANLLLLVSVASAEAFGTPTLRMTVATVSIISLEAFGLASLRLALSVTAIATAEAFGAPALTLRVSASAIASLEAFGAAVVQSGTVTILPAGIASQVAFGSPNVVRTIAPAAVSSVAAFGTALLQQYIAAIGISTALSFGAPRFNLSLPVTSIASAGVFGVATLVPGAISIIVSSLASLESFGVPSMLFQIGPVGLASAEAFSVPVLVVGAAVIQPAGISSGLTFGIVIVVGGFVGLVPERTIYVEAEPRGVDVDDSPRGIFA